MSNCAEVFVNDMTAMTFQVDNLYIFCVIERENFNLHVGNVEL